MGRATPSNRGRQLASCDGTHNLHTPGRVRLFGQHDRLCGGRVHCILSLCCASASGDRSVRRVWDEALQAVHTGERHVLLTLPAHELRLRLVLVQLRHLRVLHVVGVTHF